MGVIHQSQTQHIVNIVIDDVERFNAMSLSMWVDLKKAFDQVQTDPSVRVVVLRGMGEKAFVSGANISEFETQRNSAESVANYNLCVAQAQDAIANCRVPVIAAISGICYGGGLGLALSCDLRYCAPNAKFRMPAARLGLGYGYDGMRSILKSLSPIAAAEAFYTAKVYDAAQAVHLGIVNAQHDDVFAHAAEVATQIATNAPLTIHAAKQAMLSIANGRDNDSTRIDQLVDACFKSNDYAEGRLAFAQKRAPQFTGN